MSIDEAIKYLKALKRCETCEEGDIGRCKSCSCYRIGSSAKCYDAIDVGVDTMHKYQKLKANYETRLKADMMAMLTEIQLEFEEEKLNTEHLHYDDLESAESYNTGIDNCIDTIQQKIDKYKAENEGK